MNKFKDAILYLGKNPQITMPLIILFWGIYYFFNGAVINVSNGLGYDGEYYAEITKHFYSLVFHNKLEFYIIQRIFPLFVVNSILTIFEIPKEDFFIVKVFQIYNLTLLVLCSVIWYRIAKIYKFDLKLLWIGFIFCFVNFGIGKHTLYYPILTDPTAFFLGFCLLYFHIKDNLIGKVITTFLGAFTWPTFIYMGIMMIIFPKNFKTKNISGTGVSANKYLAFIIPLPFLIMALYYINKYFISGSLYGGYQEVLIQIIPSLLYISSVLNFLVMSYFFFIFLPANLPFSKYFQFLKEILFSIKIKNVLICILLFTIVNVFQKYFSSEFDQGEKFLQIIYWVSFLKSCSKPLVYIITAITYFGPFFIILFFNLKNFKSHLKNLGIGVYLSFIIAAMLMFESNPREIINFVPFIVLLTVLVLKDLSIQKNLFILLTIFSLILSKFYLPIFIDTSTLEKCFQFPTQFYFMNSYQLSIVSYYIQGILIILMTIFVLIAIRKNKSVDNGTKDY